MARARKTEPPQPDLFSALEAPPAAPEAAPAASVRPVPPPPPAFRHLAQIAIEGPVRGLFTYIADEFWEQLAPGTRVLVPWGHRKASGFFIGEKRPEDLGHENIDPAKLKPILRLLDVAKQQPALLTPALLALADWMARHYAAPLGSVLAARVTLPVKFVRVRFTVTDCALPP